MFPSESDTFGNVIQEANASGVPAIVTSQGGPKFIVRHDETGFITESYGRFCKILDFADKRRAKVSGNEIGGA